MHKLRVIGVDMGSDECILHVEIINDNGEVIGIAYGERNARLFAEANEMFDLIKDFAENEDFDYDSYKYAEKLIERVEDSPELTFDGLTMRELLENVVKNVEAKSVVKSVEVNPLKKKNAKKGDSNNDKSKN